MPNQLNMYQGITLELEEIISKINNAVILYEMKEDGFKEILGCDVMEADAIKVEVARMQGRLETLVRGMGKDSIKRKTYIDVLDLCKQILQIIE